MSEAESSTTINQRSSHAKITLAIASLAAMATYLDSSVRFVAFSTKGKIFCVISYIR